MAERIPEPHGAGADPADEVADLLHAVSHRIRMTANHDLGPLGITWAQVRALRSLARAGEPIRMSELAARLRVARRSATSVVDELVERGLVARSADPSDRRVVTVEVTAPGWELLDDLDRRRRAAASRLTGTLPAGDLVALRDLLRRLDPG